MQRLNSLESFDTLLPRFAGSLVGDNDSFVLLSSRLGVKTEDVWKVIRSSTSSLDSLVEGTSEETAFVDG